MTKQYTRLLLILLASLLVAACTMPRNPSAPAHSGMPISTPHNATPGSQGDQKIMDSNQPFDLLFIDSMIMHHQGAINMAQAAQTKAEHTELKTLANDIIAAQTAEIKQMQAWRMAWYPNATLSKGLDMGMGAMQIADDPSRPFDLRFIEAMIPHHQSAIDMAKMAEAKSEHTEIKTLAANIIKAQTAEIDQMQAWKATWFKS